MLTGTTTPVDYCKYLNDADICKGSGSVCTSDADTYYWSRGLGGIESAEDYYWFSKIVGDSSLMTSPADLTTNGRLFFLSALFKWMIPQNKPSAHNIMSGQWEPQDEHFNAGILSGGFGAVMQLYNGGMCGDDTNVQAKLFTKVYKELLTDFAVAAADQNPWWESDNCDYSYGDWPKDSYNKFA